MSGVATADALQLFSQHHEKWGRDYVYWSGPQIYGSALASMQKRWAICRTGIVDGAGEVTERKLGNHAPGSL